MKSVKIFLEYKLSCIRKNIEFGYFAHTYSTNRIVSRLKCAKVINVVFILQDLGAWKTELLYKEMLGNERFNPIIAIVPSYEENDVENLSSYMDSKNYRYKVFCLEQNIGKILNADIIFLQKPYPKQTEVGGFAFYKYPKALYCYVNYAFHTVDEKWALNTPYLNYAWQVYFENELCIEGPKRLMDNGGVNIKVTGLPIQDELILRKHQADPWKKQDVRKKRVIWAPHHTITEKEWIGYSTFLDYCEDMLRLAEKYRDKIQFAFKPHPLLYPKLVKIWGKAKTDSYYQKWKSLDNGQFCTGKYIDLFDYSDAMIHDCSSFTIEYHYTLKPVLYLEKDTKHADTLNPFGREAYLLHYRAHNIDDVENFLNNVVNNVDPLKEQRVEFYSKNLLPPYGKSASVNIINAILDGIKGD